MKNAQSKNWEAARHMPPRRHTIPGQAYDVHRSEAVQWLARQPELMQQLFDMVKNRELIEYDPATGLWTGVDYEA